MNNNYKGNKSNNTLLVNLQTSVTDQVKDWFKQILEIVDSRRYSEKFLKNLEAIGVNIDYIEKIRKCSMQWYYRDSKESDNWYVYLDSCRQRGCPVCAKNSLIALKLQYEPDFIDKENLIRFTYTWKKCIINEDEYDRRRKNIRALDRRLERAGLVNEALVRSIEWTDKYSKKVEDGINYHMHELRSAYVDISKVNQPVRYIEIKDKIGNIKYKGECGLFEEIRNGERFATHLDGYLNVWVLGKIWKEITGDSFRVFTEKIYDHDHGLQYVLKYASKNPYFKFPENLKTYLNVFANKKRLYKGKLNKKNYRKIACKIVDSDTDTRFSSVEKKFDYKTMPVRQSRYTLRYIEMCSKKVIKEVKVVRFAFVNSLTKYDKDFQEDPFYIKCKELREYLLKNQNNEIWQIKRLFNVSEAFIKRAKAEQLFYELSHGYLSVLE